MSELFIPGQRPKPPLHEDGTPKKRFEVVTKPDGSGGLKNAVLIDGEELDWSVDLNSLADAIRMGPKYFRAVQASIISHYLECVSEVVGRRISPEELKQADKTGWI